jgi:hypothetical protein
VAVVSALLPVARGAEESAVLLPVRSAAEEGAVVVSMMAVAAAERELPPWRSPKRDGSAAEEIRGGTGYGEWGTVASMS